VIAEARGIGTMQEKTGSGSSDDNLFEVVIECGGQLFLGFTE